MGKFLLHHEGVFVEWSTVVDAPVSEAMNLDELSGYIRNRYGEEGIDQLPARIARAVEKGTSCIGPSYTFDDIVAGNRAGPDEAELSRDELIAEYFTRRMDGTQ